MESTMPDSVVEEAIEVVITFPLEATFKCPICDLSYAMHTSWTRHLKSHPEPVSLQFKCRECDKNFSTRRSVSNHYSKTHGTATPAIATVGDYPCNFCDKLFPSQTSQSQHIRNQHATETSVQRAALASAVVSNFWTDQEHSLFLNAIAQFGTSSNVKIANHIDSKSAKQVASHKRIFLHENPNWTTNLRSIL